MRVSCPSCATAYEVPDRVLGAGGRTLRCARCGTEWTIATPEPEPRPEEAITESLFPLSPQPEPPERELPERELPERESAEPEPIAAAGSPHMPPLVAVPEPSFSFDRMLGQPRQPPRASRREDVPARMARPAASAAVWLAWAGTIILLVLLIWCGYEFRTEVMHIWPASERLYALLGMATASAPQ